VGSSLPGVYDFPHASSELSACSERERERERERASFEVLLKFLKQNEHEL
jgi:hypothetical protein